MTTIMIRPSYGKPAQASRPLVAQTASSPWLWMTLACLLLGLSGGLRFWRDWQFATLAAKSDHLPFHLSELPRTIGDWESNPKDDGTLDAKVARIAGSSDYIMRTYLDKKTGDDLTALVIYGRSFVVNGHSPDICYPTAGYQLVRGPVDREISVPGANGKVRYRWSIYMKRVGGVANYQETYHLFYYNGVWLPDAKDQWKSFRYHPSMFRILIDHPISGLNDSANRSVEDMLIDLIRETNSRMSPPKAGNTKDEPSTAAEPEPDSSKPKGGGPA
jgi:hypothetical protein